MGIGNFMEAGSHVAGLFENVGGMVKTWGGPLLFVVGAILVIVAIVKIAKGLMSHGQGQVNWVLNIACLLIGGLLIAASTTMFDRIESAGNVLNDDLGELLGTSIVLDIAE